MKRYWVILIVFKNADIKSRFYGTFEELSGEVNKMLSNDCCRYGEPKTILITAE